MPSIYEKRAYSRLSKKHRVSYIKEKTVLNGKYRIDIILKSYSSLRLWKLCIEIDWEFHWSFKQLYRNLKKLRFIQATIILLKICQDIIRDLLLFVCGYHTKRVKYYKSIEDQIDNIIRDEKIWFWFKVISIIVCSIYSYSIITEYATRSLRLIYRYITTTLPL